MHRAQALSLQQPWYRVVPNVWQENLLLQMLSSISSSIEIQVWNLTGQRLKRTVPVRKVNPLLFFFLLPLPLSSQLAVSHCSYQIRSQCVLNGTLGHFFCVAALRSNLTWSYHHGSCQRTGESGVYPEWCRGALSCSISFVSNGKPEEHQRRDGTSGLDSQLQSSFCWQLISHSGTWTSGNLTFYAIKPMKLMSQALLIFIFTINKMTYSISCHMKSIWKVDHKTEQGPKKLQAAPVFNSKWIQTLTILGLSPFVPFFSLFCAQSNTNLRPWWVFVPADHVHL